MLVYCDTNVYCRPFDDQSQSRVKEETDAFWGVLERVQGGQVTLVSSDVLVLEAQRIPNPSKRRLVGLYLSYCTQHIPASLQIVRIAEELVEQCQLKPKDAFHVASACQARVTYFVTCDDRVTKKREAISEATKRWGSEVDVLNPRELLCLFGT